MPSSPSSSDASLPEDADSSSSSSSSSPPDDPSVGSYSLLLLPPPPSSSSPSLYADVADALRLPPLPREAERRGLPADPPPPPPLPLPREEAAPLEPLAARPPLLLLAPPPPPPPPPFLVGTPLPAHSARSTHPLLQESRATVSTEKHAPSAAAPRTLGHLRLLARRRVVLVLLLVLLVVLLFLVVVLELCRRAAAALAARALLDLLGLRVRLDGVWPAEVPGTRACGAEGQDV